jgi:hypothetical protein
VAAGNLPFGRMTPGEGQATRTPAATQAVPEDQHSATGMAR